MVRIILFSTAAAACQFFARFCLQILLLLVFYSFSPPCDGQRAWSAGAGAEGEEGSADVVSQDGEVLVSEGAPFETHLWRARLAIQRATNAMLQAYEVGSSGRRWRT